MRLIDADALRDLMEQVCWDRVEMRAVQKTIDEQSTIDAVPVVRCKDCKYRNKEDGFCEGRGWPMQLVPDDGFCDKGKRSEDE